MNFKLWLEAQTHPELLALVKSMMAQRYEHTPRLVAADWLDENNEPELAQMIRLSYQLMNGNFPTLGAGANKSIEFYSYANHVSEKLIKENIFVKPPKILVFKGKNKKVTDDLEVQGHGVVRFENRFGHNLNDPGPPNRGIPTIVDLDELPENIIKAIIYVISCQMMVKSPEHEILTELQNALDEIYFLTTQYQNIIYANGQPSPQWMNRLDSSVQRLVSVADHPINTEPAILAAAHIERLEKMFKNYCTVNPNPPKASIDMQQKLEKLVQKLRQK